MAAKPLPPIREARVQRLQREILDALACRACLGALALQAFLSHQPNPLDYRVALDRLRKSRSVVSHGGRRSAVYALAESGAV